RPLAAISLLVMVLFLIPLLGLRLDNSDAGNDPTNTSTYKAFNLLADGFGPGFNGPLLIATELPSPDKTAELPAIRAALAQTPGIVAVAPPQVGPSGKIAVIRAYPASAPQDQATTDLVNHLRHDVLPPLDKRLGVTPLVGGFTAGSIDFSNVMASKLPL